ncbi:MAG: ABC transporter ATP-binding protein [Lachnospiraceae bacterium]
MIASIRKVFEFAGRYRKMLRWAMVAGVLKSCFDILQVAALYLAIGAMLAGITSRAIAYVTIVMLTHVAGKFVFSAHADYYRGMSGLCMCTDKRLALGDKLRYAPMGFFSENNIGKISSAVTTDMFIVEMMGPFGIGKIINGVFHALLLAVSTIVLDWRIGLTVLAAIVLYSVFFMLMQRYARSEFPKTIEASSKLAATYLEYVRGMSVVRAYNSASAAHEKLKRDINSSRKEHLSLELGFAPYSLCLKVVLGLGSAAVMLLSALFYLEGTVPLVNAVTMVAISFMIFAELEASAGISPIIRGVTAAIEKLGEVYNMPRMDTDGRAIAVENTTLDAQHITFAYEEKAVIEDVSMTIPKGSSVALIGPSGGGKTTLCKLFARFWDVDEGAVLLDGYNLKEFEFDSFISNISMVFQNVYLFSDTVENNIRFGKPEATRQEVIVAAKKACCHEFIGQLEQGYDTVIGEGGGTLSGGEKQRISIARAILKDAPIIILDEATSSIDPENELQMIRALAALAEGKTVITIAHKLSTIRNADCIYVIENGRIVQKGTHRQLLAKEGLYRQYLSIRENSAGWQL